MTIYRPRLPDTWKECFTSELRRVESERRPKRLLWPVRIPAALACEPVSDCPATCAACIVQDRQTTAPQALALDDLIRGRGVPFKVLLTIFRYARISNSVPLPPDDSFLYQTTARLPTKVLAEQVLGGDIGSSEDEKAVRRALEKLKRMDLVHSVDDPGRPNVYVPHQWGGGYVSVPQNLWRNGWIQAFDGVVLLVLITLITRPFARLRDVPDWWRLPPGARDLVVRGLSFRPLVELRDIPLSARERRHAVDVLKRLHLLAEVRSRRERFLLVLDPELHSRPPDQASVVSDALQRG